MTTLSILMPLFNAKDTLRDAIDSVLSQSLADFRFVIVDDCSTDGSYEIAAEIAGRDPRIHLVRNAKNGGVVRSLNEGLKHCDSKYIARMDADDIMLPGRLKAQVRFLDQNPEISIVGGQVYLMGAKPDDDVPNPFPTTPEQVMKRMMSDNCLCHPAVMFRKSMIDSLGGYHEYFKNAEDYDLWMRALKHGHGLANLDQYILRYRISLGGATISKRWEQYLYYRFAQALYLKDYKVDDYQALWREVENKYAPIEKAFIAESLLSTSEQLLKLKRYKEGIKVFRNVKPSVDLGWLKSALQTVVGGLTRIRTVRQIEKYYTPYS